MGGKSDRQSRPSSDGSGLGTMPLTTAVKVSRLITVLRKPISIHGVKTYADAKL